MSVGEDGATHQCLEDLALMRTIPGMTVLCPADAFSMREAVRAMLDYQGPVYIRLGRLAVNSIYHDRSAGWLRIGKGEVLRNGADVTLLATGLEVQEALIAAERLAEQGVSAAVADLHTLKPLDGELVADLARRTGAVVTAEEHNAIGGLGDAVLAALTDADVRVPLEKVAVQDVFGHSGKGDQLLDEFGLRAGDIVAAALRAIARK